MQLEILDGSAMVGGGYGKSKVEISNMLLLWRC